MGFFNFFSRKGDANGAAVLNTPQRQHAPEIPENIFIARDVAKEGPEPVAAVKNENGISVLFAFLERDHESKGYDDALLNPDSHHLQANLEALGNELERTIRKVKTFYEDFVRELNFHIVSRSRSGMIDTVEELTMKRDIAEGHMQKIGEIEEDAKNKKGDSQGIIISYTRGFHNGLAAISHHSILNRKF